MSFDFTGKRVLVTGAGRGFGRALTIALAKAGCHVFAVSRTESTLISLKEECPSVTTIVLDISNWDETRKTLEKLDAMDGIVNNAGIFSSSPDCWILDVPKEDIDRHIDTNLLAAINVIQISTKKMIDAEIKGSIVNISGLLSKAAMAGALSYCVSKAGLDMVSKQFALELGPHGIRVNSINPTVVMTDMGKNAIKGGLQLEETLLKRTPIGRFPDINEIVGPILYYLSDYSSAVTGTTHNVDGGLLSNIAVMQ